MALPQQKLDSTEARLSAMTLPPSQGWLGKAREDALARVRTMGLPSRRDEYWKYTRPDTLVQQDAPKAALYNMGEAPVFSNIDRLHLIFVDGVFDPDASDDLELSGVSVELLSKVGDKDIHWATGLYGSLEQAGQSPVQRPLAALNSAFATDGVMIHVSAVATKPINISYLHRDETSDACLHHVIKLDEGAKLTLLENGPAAARLNKVLEVDVANGAEFRHIRTQGRAHERRAATHIFGRLGQNSVFKSFTLTANGALTRNECVLKLQGDNAVAHIAGACVGDGDFHHDDTVFITHNAADCESRQVFKKVLRNGATGVFQGKILVNQIAQKTDGYQISQSLLLDGDSQFLAKPELEIYADDVACSHGSTSGAIDEECLFYLKSRGVPHAQAMNLLVLAFLAEAVAEIDEEEIANEINGRLADWLERRMN